MIRRQSLILTILTALFALTVMPVVAAERPVAAERLTIRWSEGAMEIVSRLPLQKILPESVALPDSSTGLQGAWFEVQNGEGETLYRRLMPAVNIAYTETPAEPGTAALSRAETTVESQVFSILIPRSASAARVVFHGPRPAEKNSRALSTEIGRLDLK